MGDAVELVPLQISPDDKKSDIREKLWSYLEKNQLSHLFSPTGKIPNFKDADKAASMLATLEVFKNANRIKVDPDKPLQHARFVTLKAGKTLLVPTPRHRPGLLTRITPPDGCDDEMLNKCATRQGVTESSVPIGVDDPIQVDLLVVGCVAVSTKGWRVGKGQGYSDLEYAMLVSNGAITPLVPVVTVVHDCQVLDLPDTLFDVHDVAVDFIVTPTRVIQCVGAKPRPAGIIWSLLPAERLDRLPILKRLRYREWKASKDVRLEKETEAPAELQDELPSTDDRGPGRRIRRRVPNFRKPRKPRSGEEDENGDASYERKASDENERSGEARRGGRGTRYFNRGRPRPRRRPRQDNGQRTSGGDVESDRDDEHDEKNRGPRPERSGGSVGRRRRFGGRGGGQRRERREPDSQPEDDDEGRDDNERQDDGRRRRNQRSDSEGGENDGERRGGGRRRFVKQSNRPVYGMCEGSVYVGALPRYLRVSDFKAEVRDRNVQPLRVVWRGPSGYAFLGFRTVDEAEKALEALEGLHIQDRNLRLEMAKSSGGGGGGGGGGGRRRPQRGQRSGDSGGGDDHDTSECE